MKQNDKARIEIKKLNKKVDRFLFDNLALESKKMRNKMTKEEVAEELESILNSNGMMNNSLFR